MRRSALALVLSAGLAAATVASAQTPPAPGPGQTQGGPGAGQGGGPGGGFGPPRTRDDLGLWSDRVFTRLDANQDGFVTGSELGVLTQGPAGAAGGARLRTAIGQSDANHDSRISREELAAGADRMFARMDKNGDGRLAGDELPQPPQAARPAAVPMPSQPDPMPMPDGSGG